jgi:magnesium-transporting ATPase (P-type)
LTETDIDLAGAIPIQKAEFQNPVLQLSKLPDIHPLLQVTTNCHTLIKVNDQLNGYSIDRKMFDATTWNFANGPPGVNSDYGVETPFLVSSPLRNRKQVEYGILKRFPFESSIKRMTVTYPFQPFRLLEYSIDFFSQKVIAQRKGNEHYNVYMKGAPEIIAKLCDPVTGSTLIHKMSWTYFVNKLLILCTVPSNYYEVLKHYTTQGYRVIALAAKTMNPQITWTRIQKMTRNEVEANLELTGLLVMWNQLKKETIPAIRILKEAHIGTVMVTGDNLETAVTVAKDCQMIDKAQRVIQVEVTIIPASNHGAQHLQVLYNDPLIKFTNETVCYFCLFSKHSYYR